MSHTLSLDDLQTAKEKGRSRSAVNRGAQAPCFSSGFVLQKIISTLRLSRTRGVCPSDKKLKRMTASFAQIKSQIMLRQFA